MDVDIEKHARAEIKRLVDKYNKVASDGRVREYNEERTKQEFILPLFRALGWDTENSKSEDEVVPEERVSRGRVDYAFRIHSIPKFFLEAKSLKADLNDPKYAQQAINYSWHKGCTWAVLTDFESVKIFNAEWQTENPLSNHVKTIACNEFLDRLSELLLLSKKGFEDGLLDKEAEKWGKKIKKLPVGDQMLDDMVRWRETLTKNIVSKNQDKKLEGEEIDEAVQRILDRLIFIRVCEDKELESPTLLGEVREWEEKWDKGVKLLNRLREVFRDFEGKYDSELFDHHLCDDLMIDNAFLAGVIKGLYETKDGAIRYDFSAIDADVLGSIYEQYLGYILKMTEKRAKVLEKHAHRKVQGIYYTPTYIVDYIVRNTLGELLKNGEVPPEKIRVLDPACGSGSFLIKAFDTLSKHYKKKGLNLDNILKYKEILSNNIYGVDLDPKAIEITRLNLLLKAAEKRGRLPTLHENIKCGNSIIDDLTVAGERAFRWEEGFKEMVKEGGFDVIIGNPPYVRQEELTPLKPYLQTHYEVYDGVADLFAYFFEREIKLLKEGGYFGMIVSNKWLKAGYGLTLRRFLSNYWIEQFIDFGDLQIFQGATTYPCIIIMRKIKKPNPKIKVCNMATLKFDSLEGYVKNNFFTVDQYTLQESGWNFQGTESSGLLEKIKKVSIPLKEYVKGDVYRGVLTGLNEAFIINENTKRKLISEDPKSAEIIKPFLKGNDVRRYAIDPKVKYLIFTRRGIDINRYHAIKKHLESFKDALTPKKSDKQTVGRKPGDYEWYEIQDVIAYYKEFDKPKILYGQLQTYPRFTFDKEGYYVNDKVFFFPFSDLHLLSVLNSKMCWYLIQHYCTKIRGGYNINWKYFGNIPIPNSTNPQLEKLAERALSLSQKLVELADKRTDERAKIEEEMKKTDAEINELVYKIYGLTEEEKKIVEESSK